MINHDKLKNRLHFLKILDKKMNEVVPRENHENKI